MFLAMRDIFYGGEFRHWLRKQDMPWAAAKEYEEAREFFELQTGFDCSGEDEQIEELERKLEEAKQRNRARNEKV